MHVRVQFMNMLYKKLFLIMFGDCSILKCLWDTCSATFFLVPTSNKYLSARWECEDLEFCMLSYCNKQYNQTMFILTSEFFRHTCSFVHLGLCLQNFGMIIVWVCGLGWFKAITVLKGYLGEVKCHLFLDFPAIKYIWHCSDKCRVLRPPPTQKNSIGISHFPVNVYWSSP